MGRWTAKYLRHDVQIVQNVHSPTGGRVERSFERIEHSEQNPERKAKNSDGPRAVSDLAGPHPELVPAEPATVAPRLSVEHCLDLLSAAEFELTEARRLIEPEPNDAQRAAWAKAAAILVEALDPARPRGDATAKQWRQFCADAVRFAKQGWLHRARAVGWSMLELLGGDQAAPFARVNRTGLILLLNGNEVVWITGRAAIIATATGACQTYRRQTIDPACVVLIVEIE